LTYITITPRVTVFSSGWYFYCYPQTHVLFIYWHFIEHNELYLIERPFSYKVKHNIVSFFLCKSTHFRDNPGIEWYISLHQFIKETSSLITSKAILNYFEEWAYSILHIKHGRIGHCFISCEYVASYFNYKLALEDLWKN
jgi:hypothetical protein